MGKTIIEHYFAKRIGDNSQDDKKFLNGRVFNTVDRFVRTKKKGGLSGRLLDVGCGDGAFVAYCNLQGLRAQGVDIADGVDFETDTFAYPDNSFDIITMFSV